MTTKKLNDSQKDLEAAIKKAISENKPPIETAAGMRRDGQSWKLYAAICENTSKPALVALTPTEAREFCTKETSMHGPYTPVTLNLEQIHIGSSVIYPSGKSLELTGDFLATLNYLVKQMPTIKKSYRR
jgi:hypothetical protein